MSSRFTLFAAAAAVLITLAPAAPAGAADARATQAQIQRNMRALKQHIVMDRNRQKILTARLAKNPKYRLPKGVVLRPGRKMRDLPAEMAGPEAVSAKIWYDMKESRAQALAAGGKAPSLDASGQTLAAFGPNKRVNDPSGDFFGDAGQSETSIAALGNNILLTWNDGNGFDAAGPPTYQLMGYGYSTDGGATWTDGGILPVPAALPNWMWSSDPVVTVNETNGEFIFTGLVFPDGAPAYLGFPTNGTTNGVGVVKGSFSGSTFTWGTPSVVVSDNNANASYDKQWVAVDPANGNIYVTYTKFFGGSNQIEFTRSTNGGTVWSVPVKLSALADDGYVQGSRVAVGPGSEVHTVWYVIGPIDKDLYETKKSVNQGVSFGTQRQAVSFFSNFSSGAPGFNRERGITYPGLAVDRTNGPNRGRVYLTWSECIDYYTQDVVQAGQTGNISEVEPNNTPANANLFTLGNTVRGTISDINTDFDFFKFTATQGQTCIFYMDSVSAGLDCAFRLYCSDQVTKLAISSLGTGFQNLIVWTAPATGTYYLRPAAWPSTSSGGTHGYRIVTIVHAPITSDRARDHRDIYVSSSADGVNWPSTGTGAPTRVNDDSPWFDNWLPEVAVTGHSRVFATWFDWRDANPSTCGGESNLYLYRSDNGGAAWSNLGLVTDATSSWTSVLSNISPNQGDYLSLFANYTGVYPAWADGRDLNPNVYAVTIPIATPTLASLASSRVEADRVELAWLASEYASQPVSLERRLADAPWGVIAESVVDGSGQVRFTDTAVAAGRSYSYRLSFGDATYSSEARIVTPSGADFALAAPQPNPAIGDLWLSFSLPRAAPATLSLVDVSGRAVRTEEVGALGAGPHRVNLAAGESLPAGVYVVVLRQGEQVRTRRVSVIR